VRRPSQAPWRQLQANGPKDSHAACPRRNTQKEREASRHKEVRRTIQKHWAPHSIKARPLRSPRTMRPLLNKKGEGQRTPSCASPRRVCRETPAPESPRSMRPCPKPSTVHHRHHWQSTATTRRKNAAPNRCGPRERTSSRPSHYQRRVHRSKAPVHRGSQKQGPRPPCRDEQGLQTPPPSLVPTLPPAHQTRGANTHRLPHRSAFLLGGWQRYPENCGDDRTGPMRQLRLRRRLGVAHQPHAHRHSRAA